MKTISTVATAWTVCPKTRPSIRSKTTSYTRAVPPERKKQTKRKPLTSPSIGGAGLLALPEIVALLDAVVLGQVDREVLTGLDRHLEAPLRVGPDRVGQFVGAGRKLREHVVPTIIGSDPAEEFLVRGVTETHQKDLVPSQRLAPRGGAVNATVPDFRVVGGELAGGALRPAAVAGQPASRDLGFLRVAGRIRYHPLELADGLVLQVEPRGADRQVGMQEEAARVGREGCAKVLRRDGPLLSGEPRTRQGHPIQNHGRRHARGLSGTLAGAEPERQADRRQA